MSLPHDFSLSADGHLGGFHFLPITKHVTANICKFLSEHMLPFILGLYRGVESLVYVGALPFEELQNWFSK